MGFNSGFKGLKYW